MGSEWILLALLALPFLGAGAAALLPPNARNAEATLAAVVMLGCFVLTLALYGTEVRVDLPWLPAYGLVFVARVDGLAWMFCTLVTGIGFLVVLYARYYMSPQDPIARF